MSLHDLNFCGNGFWKEKKKDRRWMDPIKAKEIVKCHKKKKNEMSMEYTWLNLNDFFLAFNH
jgi:hypothetical protein